MGGPFGTNFANAFESVNRLIDDYSSFNIAPAQQQSSRDFPVIEIATKLLRSL
jgi:hypothetical protein